VDFADDPEEAAFRASARAWLDATLPGLPHPSPAGHEEKVANQVWWQRALAEGGWVGLAWPAEVGGRGLPITYEAIFNEESARRRAPAPINLLGTLLAGPTILVHGTPEQQQTYLPQILDGTDVWCQGFSEPGAGSDLASLRTAARLEGDEWVVDGQKVWTSFAHAANRCMLLVRTEAVGEGGRHRGITYLLADTDGIEIRPLVMSNGEKDFNEMFLSDVRVPAERVLGEVGGGWRVALTTLAFERGSLAFVLSAEAQGALDAVCRLAAEQGVAEDPDVVRTLGRLAGRVRALRWTTVRQMSAVSRGGAPGGDGSAVKLAWAQTMQDLTRFALRLTGDADTAGATWAHHYLRARGNSVEGGTDEVQRSIIAEQVLGLPRSR
jgi:alkylation response protein AidB-like acyl-CoA dehydrogenase